MKTRTIVVGIVKRGQEYLIAKRASTKKFAPKEWEFISGFVDTNETAEQIILRELKEETKLKGVIKKTSGPFQIIDKEGRWIIIPYLVEVKNRNFKINSEDHSEARWVKSKDLSLYKDILEYCNKMQARGLLK